MKPDPIEFTIKIDDPFDNQPYNFGKVKVEPYYVKTLNDESLGFLLFMGTLYKVKDKKLEPEEDPLQFLDKIREITNNEEYLKAEKYIFNNLT
ncbi:MAG: hypothetical protein K9H48_07705 [Melioribacteraceae bacterium]|nr:hypothetical protein [Melioribacteraceae bacterium]